MSRNARVFADFGEALREKRRKVPYVLELACTPLAVETVYLLLKCVLILAQHHQRERLAVLDVRGARGFHGQLDESLGLDAPGPFICVNDILQDISKRTIPPSHTQLKSTRFISRRFRRRVMIPGMIYGCYIYVGVSL